MSETGSQEPRQDVQERMSTLIAGGRENRAAVGWLSDLYELNIAALLDFGFTPHEIHEEVPAFEQVRDSLRPGDLRWLHRGVVDEGQEHELAITPSIQRIGLVGGKNERGLIPRFDRKQSAEDKTKLDVGVCARHPLADKDPRYDNGFTDVFPVGILLGDTKDPLRPASRANGQNAPGLVYVNQKTPEFAKEQQAQALLGRDLQPATIGQIMIVNAQRRLTGKPFLDERTVVELTNLGYYGSHTRGDTRFDPSFRVDQYVGIKDGRVVVGDAPMKGAKIIHSPKKDNPIEDQYSTYIRAEGQQVYIGKHVNGVVSIAQIGMRRALRVPIVA